MNMGLRRRLLSDGPVFCGLHPPESRRKTEHPPPLPIDHGTIVWVVARTVFLGLADLRHQFVFVDSDAEPWRGRQFPMAILHRRQGFCEQVRMLGVASLLNEEIGYRRCDLEAGSERARALGIVGCDRRVVGFRHARDQAKFGDATCVADVRLKDHRGFLFQNLPEAPLREDPLPRSQSDVRLLRQLRHYVYVQRLNHLLVEPWMIRFKGFNQKLCSGRLDRPMKIDSNIDARPLTLTQRLETLCNFVHELLPFHLFEWGPSRVRSHLHGVYASSWTHLAVNTNSVAGGAAEQLINRHAVKFAFDVPESLIDTAQDCGLDRPSAIECAAMDRLPMKHHAIRILADQVPCGLERACGAGLGVVLQHLAPAGDARVSRDLHEHP